MKRMTKLDISKKKYKDLYVGKVLDLEVGKKYKRKFKDEKENEVIKEIYITEILEINDGGLIIKSIVV